MSSGEGRPLDRPIIMPEVGGGDNRVLPFAIEGMDVRGRAVRLGTVADAIITAHDYPPAVAQLMGETLALAALFGSLLKEKTGVVTVQARGAPGALIDFLVVNCAAPGHLRGYATARAAAADPGGTASLGALLGSAGTLAVTLDQGARGRRYQGIVPLDAPSLAAAAEQYFTRSEQIPTALRLAASRDAVSGHWRAGGIMIQHLARAGVSGPAAGSEDRQENWRRARILMESVRREELLDPQLDLETLLFRLFHEDGVRVYAPIGLSARCRCSRARLRDVITRFSATERAEMTVGGKIAARCQFCGKTYRFDPAEFDG